MKKIYRKHTIKATGGFTMSDFSNLKHSRILHLYTRLIEGDVINKRDEAERYGVNERSIQRDLDDLRAFFEEETCDGRDEKNLIYDRRLGGYRVETESVKSLTNSEVLAVSKILLESRAFCREELEPILSKLLLCCVPRENYKRVESLIANEKFHYVPPHHNTKFVDKLWDIGVAVDEHRLLKIRYVRAQENSEISRTLEPVGIMFSEFYFYLIAFICGKPKEFPAIYRIDRIRDFEVTDKRFVKPYRDRFEEGEFRKKIQFMYGGELRRIEFDFCGDSIEAVLDRLPTARIIREENGVFTVRAEVYGKGVDMWLRSQGEWVLDVRGF
jgi:predicted DNA-binding transcriptional regulator YafY